MTEQTQRLRDEAARFRRLARAHVSPLASLLEDSADALDHWHDVRAKYLSLYDGQDALAQQFPALAEALCRAVYGVPHAPR